VFVCLQVSLFLCIVYVRACVCVRVRVRVCNNFIKYLNGNLYHKDNWFTIS